MKSETVTHFPLNWAPQKLVDKKSETFLGKLIKSREKATGQSPRETIHPGLTTPEHVKLQTSFSEYHSDTVSQTTSGTGKISNTKERGQNKHKQKMEIKLETTLREKKKERERVITIFKESEQTLHS